MLLQKPIEPGDVIVIKMITGEEILAKLVSDAADSITISKPLIVSVGQDRAGNVGIQMLPYFLLCGEPDAKLTIKHGHVITRTLATDQAKAGYLQQTTGLTMTLSSPPTGITK